MLAEYVHRSTSVTIEGMWPDIATAPGNDNVRLRAARVLRASGARNEPIDVATDFNIEIEYWNLTPSDRVTISVNVHRDDGLLVFSTGTLEPLPRGNALYRETGRVPGNLMNEGFYTIELAVVYGQRSVYRHENLLGFHIADRADLRPGGSINGPGRSGRFFNGRPHSSPAP